MAYIYKGTIHDLESPAPKAERHPSTPGPKPKPYVFNPSACGTVRGYKRHKKAGLDACQACKDANAAYSRAYAARLKTADARDLFNPDKCGSYAGYKRHERAGIPACDPCLSAYAEYMQAYRAELRARKVAA